MDDYDYVIVGAGSAGCVLAARLTEDTGCRVLLLEAGPPDDDPRIRMPAAAGTLWQGPYARDDWTVPQEHAGGRRIFLSGGHTLGGGSAINGMVYVRGNPVDYDGWRDRYGCAGWGFADLLPYFRRAEEALRVDDAGFVHPLSRAWLDAAVAAGLPADGAGAGVGKGDGAGARVGARVGAGAGVGTGVGFYRATRHGGRRRSAADAYLRPALDRPGLTVRTGVRVSGVLVERGRAVGVRFADGGEVRATREVVLCAGAIGTPHLLLLSGIGPAAQLSAHGVDVVADVPRVGAGLQDHPRFLMEWGTPDTPNLWEEATPETVALWEATGAGPMSSCGAEAGGFVGTRAGLDAPDLQIGVIPGPAPGPTPPDRRGVTMLVDAAHVRSRGSVTLRTADPGAAPAIDPAYLADPADLDVLVAGARMARAIAAREPLAGLVEAERSPGVEVDGDTLRDWIRAGLASMFHPTGTCAMGGRDDAVCDPTLRLRGVDGVRVVDASVMPAIPRSNTNGPTIALAERAADVIRGRVAPAASGTAVRSG